MFFSWRTFHYRSTVKNGYFSYHYEARNSTWITCLVSIYHTEIYSPKGVDNFHFREYTRQSSSVYLDNNITAKFTAVPAKWGLDIRERIFVESMS